MAAATVRAPTPGASWMYSRTSWRTASSRVVRAGVFEGREAGTGAVARAGAGAGLEAVALRSSAGSVAVRM
ncbi:hypothetical protein F3K40_15285 [Streptomyces sp. LBUM 1478]|nr:hypothetical protein [Streptomyces sp. LBUM 1478]